MTILKGHSAVPGGRARPCRAIALLLPTPPVSVLKASGSALASLRGFGAGAGQWLQAGRRRAIGTRRHRGTLCSLLFVFLSFWAFCFKGSALRMFSFTCFCRCNCLPSDVPFFYLGKSLARFTRRTYGAQELPAHTSICNLSSDKARRPGAHHPIRESKMGAQSGAWALFAGEAPRLAPGRSLQPRPSPRQQWRRAVPAVHCSFSARHSSPGVTALLIRWRRLWTASADTGWGDELQCLANWQSTRRRV